ncbi:MAG TPA: pseudouridine synthase [Cyclobacteriaceae bacterium]|nr:pseudouridine synthase [Cyclobacteriaceae bacterium]
MILWEDNDYMVINKPPHLATLADRSEPVSVLSLARTYADAAQVCHRLDKDTSGILAIAKNPEAYRHLNMQFEKRTVGKIYHAVVDGLHQFENRLVDMPIIKMDDGLVRIGREGKPAQTYFISLRSYKGHTLVECRPITGRMHQIRIHLSTMQAPITGDDIYGGKPFYLSSVKRSFNLKKDTDEQPLMKRMALHAYSLEFKDTSGNSVKVVAPYPKDFQALVRQLEANE